MNDPLIIERLIECRQKLGITKQEAAKRMQMSQPAYLRYESGERTPSIHVIHFMANVLSTTAEYLTGTTDDPSPTSYLICADQEPDLYALIETYKNSDKESQKRLMTYVSKLET
jgi:transcriptional regulator with XRE-family HTH domain